MTAARAAMNDVVRDMTEARNTMRELLEECRETARISAFFLSSVRANLDLAADELARGLATQPSAPLPKPPSHPPPASLTRASRSRSPRRVPDLEKTKR